MIVLGVDPGFASLGLAAVELLPVGDRVLRCWVERTEQSSKKRTVRASEDNVRRAQELALALEQARELARVEKGIALHVLAFCREHATFRSDELRAYVQERTGRAPASPDRILRQLRSRGLVSYKVTDRAASLYAVQAVRG